MNAATIAQIEAAEPGASTWLSANAGSGKTKVLTDRVARLLLAGTEPQNILCLTYTKAAASEMQNRLFERLGAWAMMDDPALQAELATMGADNVDDHARLAEARRLFARAIDTPGGLRIQTIHAFCASLLRRFPMEAGVTPNFKEIDERSSTILRDAVLDEMADGTNVDTFDAMAEDLGGDVGQLVDGILRDREALTSEASKSDVFGWLGLPQDYSFDDVLDEAFDGTEGRLMSLVLTAMSNSDKPTDQKQAERLQAFDWSAPGLDALNECFSIFLYGENAKKNGPLSAKLGSFPTKDTQAALGHVLDDLEALMTRVEGVRDRLLSLVTAQRTIVLQEFAQAFLRRYEAKKQTHGWLDFDDLIQRTRALLGNPQVAAWVLFRLDGGLDHILVDEAQDTSPAQWQVIERLAQEFTAGIGARSDHKRTIFVVGDKKQSIYSFQGADPREFDRMQRHFDEALSAIDTPLHRRALAYSFRSSDAILRFVDRAVAGAVDEVPHKAFRENLPGRVDLWPPVPKPTEPERADWFDPVDVVSENHEAAVLAAKIAAEIRRLVDTETIPAENGSRCPITPGDFLVLVRRRSGPLFHELIRSCKSQGLAVAGADRLRLMDELAVMDLVALLSFLATQEDDLSLATILKSPLFGWTEGQLFDLAHRRSGYLWEALRAREEDHPETLSVLRDLRNNTDFLRPFDLLERVLTRHNGRKLLLGRLGPEAEDGIDALLDQALAYEQTEIPSLTGFLTWLASDDVEIKREMDSAGDQVRVMTVHGAKGLEESIVILPDTAKRQSPDRAQIVPLDSEKRVWRNRAAERPDVVRSALADQKSARLDEEDRLFYVAVTRAKSWLIIAAAGDVGGDGTSWHQKAELALKDMPWTPIETPVGEGLRFSHAEWATGAVVQTPAPTENDAAVPGWALERAPMPTVERKVVAPSDLGGAKALPGPVGETEEFAQRWGRCVHALLEQLPAIERENWVDWAARICAAEGFDDVETDVLPILKEATTVLDDPSFEEIFGDAVLAEVDIAADLEVLGAQVSGAIDRLIITEDCVHAIDFKSNRSVPKTAEDVPEGILRQMGAYQAALQKVYPDRRVDTSVLWTSNASLMPLPHEIVRAALQRAATS